MNDKISKHLSEIAYFYTQSGEGWKARAFSNAATIVGSLGGPIPLDSKGKLAEKIAGIGDGIAGVIEEFCRSGSSEKWKRLEKRCPPLSLQELQRIPQVGAATAKKLWEKHGVSTLAEFEAAIPKFKGTEFEKYVAGFERIKGARERVPRWVVTPVVEDLLKGLGLKWGFAGSTRRGRELIRDVDVIVTLGLCYDLAQEVLRKRLEFKGLRPDIREGSNKWGINLPIQLPDGSQQTIPLDLNFCTPENEGAYFLYLTGSKEFNIEMRAHAKECGFLLNEHGLFLKDKLVFGETEKHIFAKLQLEFIPPECRGQGVLRRGRWDDLLKVGDLLGDFHCHTTISDGLADAATMAQAAQKEGLKFLGIADHSKGSGGGPSEDEMWGLVKTFRQSTFPIEVLLGAEVDIKASGDLDYSESLLKELDYCVLAVHHSPANNLTERLCGAMQKVKGPKILAHPTCRNLEKFVDSYPANWSQVFRVAQETGTVLEINGHLSRQDLPPDLIKEALARGCKFAISSDAHSPEYSELHGNAIRTARRGLLPKEKVMTASIPAIRAWLREKAY